MKRLQVRYSKSSVSEIVREVEVDEAVVGKEGGEEASWMLKRM